MIYCTFVLVCKEVPQYASLPLSQLLTNSVSFTSHTSPSEYTVNEPSSIGNIGRPVLSRVTGVIRRRGWADGRDFLDDLAIIDDVTSSAAPKNVFKGELNPKNNMA